MKVSCFGKNNWVSKTQTKAKNKTKENFFTFANARICMVWFMDMSMLRACLRISSGNLPRYLAVIDIQRQLFQRAGLRGIRDYLKWNMYIVFMEQHQQAQKNESNQICLLWVLKLCKPWTHYMPDMWGCCRVGKSHFNQQLRGDLCGCLHLQQGKAVAWYSCNEIMPVLRLNAHI